MSGNWFRRRRARRLSTHIAAIAHAKGNPIRILDVGGSERYWNDVDLSSVGKIVILNNDPDELLPNTSIFSYVLGDALDLSEHQDQSFDLLHSNSVIEHVGDWNAMMTMASEARRVGASGWVQTPAFGFPIEPHYRLPAVHWFGTPLKARLIRLSKPYRSSSLVALRQHAERINLVSKREMSELFESCEIEHERFIATKSFIARW